jgi:penicillin G amidase
MCESSISRMNRIVKYVNIAIAIVAVVALAVVYWAVYRPLPQTSGVIAAPGIQKATAARDRLGVPHIRAASLEDTFFVEGYVTAQDRLWQMDGLRRLSGGNLAEVIGVAGRASDQESRQMRLRRIAEAAYTTMAPAERAAMAAYARGVNHFIDTHAGRYPLEFRLLHYDPKPWSVVDSILIALHMFRTLTTTWKDELLKRSMLLDGDPAKVNFLFPARSGGELQPGSNAWAVSGAHTASHKPLLSNDMHLEWSIPGIWYMAHLQAPGLNVSGVTLPGVPGVIVGHNDRIAWGVTNLHFDVQDLYLEKINDATGQYLYRGLTEQAQPEREYVRVRGGDPLQFILWVTRHGPVFVAEGRERMSLRWTAAEPGIFQFPFLDVDRAHNWQEFTTAISRFPGPGQNFVYADVDGNIGYHAAGKLPIRRNYSGDVPVDGSLGEFEWDGFVPFEQLPSVYNPPSGIIVTANQNPFPADYSYQVNGSFASHYRSRQIRDRLTAREGWRPEDMLSVQTDIYSGFSHYLAKSIVAAYERRKAHNPDLEDAIGFLRGWNGQMEKSLPAPLIVTLAYQHLRRAVAEVASPQHGAAYDLQMAPAALETMLRTRPAGWFPDYDLLLLRVLADGVEEGRRIEGRAVRKWQYGDYLRLTIAHPIGHRLPVVARYFDIGPTPMSGSSTTPKQTSLRLGPSMRMTADLSDWERSLLNITTGQSGQFLSSHYKDEWDHYYNGQSYPMQFSKVDAPNVLEFVPGR